MNTPRFTIGAGVRRAGMIRRYERKRGDPLARPLQIYSTDPADSKLDGAHVVVMVPYEEIVPGPIGSLLEVVGLEERSQAVHIPLDLNDPRLLCANGLTPAPTSRFQMQMTYAVAMMTYYAFRKALGRDLHWGFDESEGTAARLKLYPFYAEMNNAFYDRDLKGVVFGWYDSTHQPQRSNSSGRIRQRNLRHGKVYTSLSHDIIVHEVSHALLDGLRPHFLKPFHHDNLALHEGFADLVAIFQHFSHRDLLETAIRRTRGKPGQSHLLTDIARQFGQTQSNPSLALRSSVDDFECDENGCSPRPPLKYDVRHEIHQLGSVLVTSVFEAFRRVFDRKAQKYIKIATRGTGLLPEGELDSSLADVLAKEASELAQQFLSVCIRAIDYCPPVAVTFGDYLRAMITADFDLVPNDPYGYRESLVDAFVGREIPIDDISTLHESELLWEAHHGEPIAAFAKAMLSRPTDFPAQYEHRARCVGQFLTNPKSYDLLGVLPAHATTSHLRNVQPPCIESARISRRVGPDGQLEMDLVVEITQKLNVDYEGRLFPAIQGSTVIVDSRGRIRYVIKKDAVEYVRRLQEQVARNEFQMERYWLCDSDTWTERPNLIRCLHEA